MMKKAPHKLTLQREIIRDLQALDEHALGQVRGGANTNLEHETGRACTNIAVAPNGDLH